MGKQNVTNDFSNNFSKPKTKTRKNERRGKRLNKSYLKNNKEKEQKNHEDLDLDKNDEKNSLGVAVWNLHGLKGCNIESFKDRTEPMVKKLFEENDIICGTETLRDRQDPDILSWDDKFSKHSYPAKRHTKTGRSTSLCIENDTRAFGNIECRDSYHVWYKLNKKIFLTINKSIYIYVFCTFHLVLPDGFSQVIHFILKN